MFRVLGLYRPADTPTAPRSSLDQLAQELVALQPDGGFGIGPGVGSNNWVVAGERTASGSPLLANDPHLGLSTPSVWYFARLQSPQLQATGATLPGVPFVVIGRTPTVAWGLTNTNTDVQDLYLERVHPTDPSRYETCCRHGVRPHRARVTCWHCAGARSRRATTRCAGSVR